MITTLVSAFYRMITNDLTYNQYIADETDEWGNPTKNGELVRGMVVSASSVYNDDRMCQPHMVFHNNPQSWMPAYEELRDGKGCHINVDLKTPVNLPDGTRSYVYNEPVIPVRTHIEIDNTDNIITEIQLWGSVMLEGDIDLSGCNLADEDVFWLVDADGCMLVEGSGYNGYLDVESIGKWTMIDSFKGDEIAGKYVDKLFTIDHLCPNDQLFNRFKLVFKVNTRKLPNHGTIYLKKWDIFKESWSNGCCCGQHIINCGCKCPGLIPDSSDIKQYIIQPVKTEQDLPIRDDLEVGTLCTVIDEYKVYMWNGERWIAPKSGQGIDEPTEEEVLYRYILLTPDSYVFSIGAGISGYKLRVEDEDGIKWTMDEDYWVEDGVITFNRELAPPYKFYPDGLKIYIYRTRPIVQESSNRIYLESYDDIREGNEVYKRVFQLVTNEDADLMLQFVGKSTDPEFVNEILFDGVGILGNNDEVYTVFANSEGYLMSIKGDYDEIGENPVTAKDYDYILIRNLDDEEEFYLDINIEGDVYTAPASAVNKPSGGLDVTKAYADVKSLPTGSRILNVRALSN